MQFARFRWPLESIEYAFCVMLSADNQWVVVLRPTPGVFQRGNGMVSAVDDVIDSPSSARSIRALNSKLRELARVPDDGAVFAFPCTYVGEDFASWRTSLAGPAQVLLDGHVAANLHLHAKLMGLRVEPERGVPKEPKAGTQTALALSTLRVAGDDFRSVAGGSRTINRLRAYGHRIESASEVRDQGKKVPNRAKGWRLVR